MGEACPEGEAVDADAARGSVAPVSARVRTWVWERVARAGGWLCRDGGWRAAVLAVAVVCGMAWQVRAHNIAAVGPYPIHVDEPFLAEKALSILQTGDWNPHYFNYPTLPVYLTVGAFAVGSARAAAHREMKSVAEIGSVGYPSYGRWRVVRTARHLFAALSVLAMALAALAAWRLTCHAAAPPLAALVLGGSALFLYHSWAYLNVDIVGAFFVTAAIVAAVGGRVDRPEPWRGWLVGALAGLATGCKYNFGIVLGSVLLGATLLGARGTRVRQVLRVLAAFVAAFVVVVPYSVFDLRSFLDGALAEVHHYATGHAGYTRPEGWGHARHFLGLVVRDFGHGSVPFAAAGIGWSLKRDWRRTAVVLSFPVALLLFMAWQRVSFERNLLTVHVWYAMFCAVGAVALCKWVAHLLSKARLRGNVLRPSRAAIAAIVVAAVLLLPLSRAIWGGFRPDDSRRRLADWLVEALPADATLVVPAELGLVLPQGLNGARVREVRFRDSGEAADPIRGSTDDGAVWVIAPVWGCDERFACPDVEVARLTALGDGGREVVRFGSKPLLVNFWEPVPYGDPLLRVVRFDGTPGAISRPLPAQ
jgi:4-amino-4-deoxy-L-arabinose transferase-like glycosyltransferase